MLIKIINEQTKQCDVFSGTDTQWAISQGFTYGECETGYDNKLYLKGYAPSKPQSVKEEEVRAVRSQYYEEYVDWYQAKPWLLEEMTEEEITEIQEYRIYLKDYTKEENWWEKNPLTFDEWKAQKNA